MPLSFLKGNNFEGLHKQCFSDIFAWSPYLPLNTTTHDTQPPILTPFHESATPSSPRQKQKKQHFCFISGTPSSTLHREMGHLVPVASSIAQILRQGTPGLYTVHKTVPLLPHGFMNCTKITTRATSGCVKCTNSCAKLPHGASIAQNHSISLPEMTREITVIREATPPPLASH